MKQDKVDLTPCKLTIENSQKILPLFVAPTKMESLLTALVTRSTILEYIPQREPICLVHSIYECSNTFVKTGFVVEPNNYFTHNGFIIEAGIIENMAQSVAAQAGYLLKQKNEAPKVGFIGQIKDLIIHSIPALNSEIITEIKLINMVMNVTIISAASFCNNKPVANCEMKVFIQQ